MAGSGIIFIGFVLLHMYGNLKAFSGHDAYNDYAEHLRILGEPMVPREGALWIIRTVLIVSLVVHVASAAALWKRAVISLASITLASLGLRPPSTSFFSAAISASAR